MAASKNQQQQQCRPVLWRTQPKVVSPRTTSSALKRPPMVLKKPCAAAAAAANKIVASCENNVPLRSFDFETSSLDLDSFMSTSSSLLHIEVPSSPSSSSVSSAAQSPKTTLRKVKKKKPQHKAADTPAPPPAPPVLKPSPQDLQAQRKSKIAHYGRKQGSPKSVPEEPLLAPAPSTKKRCGWITSQSDAVHIAYHDQEWGVPVHDDRLLFELLTLASAQSELSWSAILSKREKYRAAFASFDPIAVSRFNTADVAAAKASIDILQQDGKVQSVVDNAARVLQIVDEFGSLNKYVWSFFNFKPIVTSFRMSSQVPIKSSRSEVISKDLIRRGFRGVAPAIVYSFMQAAGMSNDHTVQCFRHKECIQISQDTHQQQHKQQNAFGGAQVYQVAVF